MTIDGLVESLISITLDNMLMLAVGQPSVGALGSGVSIDLSTYQQRNVLLKSLSSIT